MQKILLLLVDALLCTLSFGAYCGSGGVPFSFEVTASGAPALGCAQPSCVAGPDDLGDQSSFPSNVQGQADGFMREGDKDAKRYRDSSAPKLIANCSGKFNEFSCPKRNQWVGGIEYIDHHRQPLLLQCCTFEGLKYSQDVGITNVKKGESVIGGEVVRDGRQISFDVIANVRKVYDIVAHEVSYEVSVRRMNCLPDPPEPRVVVDEDAPGAITRVLKKANTIKLPEVPQDFGKKDASKESKAFGAPALKIAIKKAQLSILKEKANGTDADERESPENQIRQANGGPMIVHPKQSKQPNVQSAPNVVVQQAPSKVLEFTPNSQTSSPIPLLQSERIHRIQPELTSSSKGQVPFQVSPQIQALIQQGIPIGSSAVTLSPLLYQLPTRPQEPQFYQHYPQFSGTPTGSSNIIPNIMPNQQNSYLFGGLPGLPQLSSQPLLQMPHFPGFPNLFAQRK